MRFLNRTLLILVFVMCLAYSLSNSIDQKHSKYHWTEAGLLDLKSQVINLAKDDFEILILYVYGNWCLSAQGRLHAFEEVATQHQIIQSRLTFGIVDVNNKEEIESFGIKEVPTILIFIKGSPFHLTWDDDIDSDGLSLQIEQMLKPYLLPTLSEDGFQSLQKIKGYDFVILHGLETEESYWDFYKTAENHFEHPINFYFVKASQTNTKSLIPMGISFCSPECKKFNSDEVNVITLYNWVVKKSSNSKSRDDIINSLKIEQFKDPLLV
jgi:hypothetical protein